MTTQENPKSAAPVVLRIILGIIMALPALAGLAIVWLFAASFAYVGFQFGETERGFTQGVLAVCAMVTTPAFIFEGILLRYARWKRAPTASLVLGVVFALTALVGTQMLLATLRPEDVSDRWTVIIFALITLVAGTAPSLDHWWRSRIADPAQPPPA